MEHGQETMTIVDENGDEHVCEVILTFESRLSTQNKSARLNSISSVSPLFITTLLVGLINHAT